MSHAKLAPSSAYRWLECPGSVNMESLVAPRETHIKAKLGTLAHRISEEFLSINTTKIEDTVFNEAINGYDHGLNTAEVKVIKDHIQTYITLINEIVEDMNPIEVLFEKKLTIIEDECYGTADAFIYNTEKVTVVDLKTGIGLVSPEDNPQLMCYLLGAMRYLCFERSVPYEMLHSYTFEAVIIQPTDSNVLKKHIYSFDDLEAFRNRLIKAYRIAYNHERVLLNSRIYKKELIDENFKEEDGLEAGAHCKWCAALGICKKAMQESMPVPIRRSLDKIISTEELTLTQITELLKRKKMIENFLSEVESRALDLLSCGQDIEGFKLGEKKTHKRWKSQEDVIENIKSDYPNLYEDCFTERKLRSPAQLTKLLGAEFVALHTFKPIGKPSASPTTH